MKAALYDSFGDPEQVKVGDIDPPEVGEGEVLVRIEAAGVNPVDAAVQRGHLQGRLPHTFPIIPGWDMAGVIEERGFSARRFEVGDAVFGYARRPVVQWGTFAEYVVIPESYLAKQPQSIPATEAGAIPLTGLTAYQSIFDAGRLEAEETILILGASGGVGSFAIQLAKTEGAEVIGVASQSNHDYMKQLGADATIDYHSEHIGEATLDIAPEGVDLIFDCSSGESMQQSLSALKNDGKLVSILNTGENLDPDIDFEYVFVEPNSSQLDTLADLVDADKLDIHISKTYSLDETPQALQNIEQRHTKGKTIIIP
ncbi:NADP-dependent oxidoreductase [Fodinibius salsisoli]|uniref:NADP-dependent oxidoreductase n=1 Tax=Fodinibius salsisoli TaxID=2820877 RepID=A0ABT3PRG2_9BACT|nr:NADP-dependent oxidoreductase [Fodinibius salsisoli]MCW9708453.1 NADP-dependent oxidoreductase [Fodinibius salsisoli]